MDQKQLEREIQPVLDICKSENIHISDVNIEEMEMFRGTASPQFYVDLCIPTLNENNYDEIYDKVFDIYWNTVDVNIRSFIADFCVNDECESTRHNK